MVSILFADLKGSTAITQKADPEETWSFQGTADAARAREISVRV